MRTCISSRSHADDETKLQTAGESATGHLVADEEIYAVNLAGSNLANLTNDPSANDSQPAFSPDGKKMAYVSARYDGSGDYVSEIYMMNPSS